MKLVYLASPYTHEDKGVEHIRYQAVADYLVKNPKEGYVLFSPIVYWHEIARAYKLNTTYNHPANKIMCETIISRCDELWVFALKGWQDSVGVTAEIEFAKFRGIPVKYV